MIVHDVQLRFVSSATTRITTLDEIFDQLFQTYILIQNEKKKKYKKKKNGKRKIKKTKRPRFLIETPASLKIGCFTSSYQVAFLTNEEFEELLKKIMEFVPPQNE